MTCTTIGKEIVRGTICRDRWNITVLVNHSEPVPLNRLSHLWLSVDWHPDTGDRNVLLVLRSQTPSSGGQVRFNGPEGGDRRTFTGDSQLLLALYGTRASGGTAPDVFLDVVVDDEVRQSIGLRVEAQPQPDVEAGLDQLQAELAVAAQPTRPTDPAQQPRWDRYARLFTDARLIADALTAIPPADIPAVGGTVTPRPFDLEEIKTHLRSHGQPNSLAETKAQGRSDAFDPFRGHWRGDWRQKFSCPPAFNICQDHQWGDTVPLPSHPELYVQRVRLGDDSRPYREGSAACTALPEAERDLTLPAVNLINIQTGVIVGAVGVRSAPDAGVVALRPHVGFYIDHGKLLWVAEESLSADGNEVTYSVFYEIREGDPVDQPLYTIQGLELRWQRGHNAIQGDITTKAGQYLKIMTAAERELERQFRDRALQPGHLAQPYYRRQLERLTPTDVTAFLDNPATSSTVRAYLERLREFVTQQKALAEAPTGPRPAITFIMGAEPEDAANQFYNSARGFFTVNPAGALITNLRTLVEVRDYLANQAPTSPWGEINIVVHANEEGGMSIPVAAGGENTTRQLLQQAIAAGDFASLADARVDVRTTLRIRGCALGQSQAMLTLLSTAFGGTDLQHPVVRAPRHLQAYSSRWTGTQANITEVEEFPVEFWLAGWPGAADQQPSRATLVQQFTNTYPGVALDWDAALRGRVAGVTQEIRSRTFTYTFAFTYPTSNPPTIGTTQAQRLAWLRANSSFDADIQLFGHAVDDYAWQIAVTIQATGPGQERAGLAAAGTRTVLRLQRNVRAQLSDVLFSLNSSLQTDLSRRTLSPALRTAFADAGHPLSEVAVVLIREVNQQWLILDPAHLLLNQPTAIRTFLVRRTDTNLTVRREDDLTTGAVVRAHPPATDLRHFGEYVPARPATQPLGENIPP